MNILIVDDEISAVEVLCKRVREVLGDEARTFSARNGRDALEILRMEQVDVLFLDVEMPGMSGLEIARRVKEEYPKTNVILCTAYEQYALKAWELYISGYLVKPAMPDDIKRALANLRTPVVEKLTVRCFGNFEVFHDGRILRFARSGAKELLACLVDRRGTALSSGELCAVLQGDSAEPDLQKASLRKYVMELRRVLAENGFADVLVHTRDNYAVNPARLDCDYYRFLEGDPAARMIYNGEYMKQYSWAESTTGLLESMRS